MDKVQQRLIRSWLPSPQFARPRVLNKSSGTIDRCNDKLKQITKSIPRLRGARRNTCAAITDRGHPKGPLMPDYLEFDPSAIDARAVYRLLTGSVVPRPIGWAST